MNPRERTREQPPRERPTSDTPPGSDASDALAQEGAAFAAAANQILDAALSGDSTAFLASNQQLGGQ